MSCVFIGLTGLNYQVSYSHFFQGLVLGCPDPQFPNVFGIHEALQNALFLSNDIILILSGYMMPIKAFTGLFYMFDSHARSPSGLPDSVNGKAVVLKFDTLQELELHILLLSNAVRIMQFEVVPITLSVIHCHNQQSLKQSETFTKKQEHLLDQLTEKEPVPKPACHPDTKKHILEFLSKKEVTIKMTETAGRQLHEHSSVEKTYKRSNSEHSTRPNKAATDSQTIRKKLHSKKNRQSDTPGAAYNTTHHSQVESMLDKAEYLESFDSEKYGTIDQQPWAKSSIVKFHNSMKMKLYQYKICNETWPLKQKAQHENHICCRCARDKGNPKKFSKDNFMLPSPVPKQLQDLTQTEEMLISCALPIMSVYVKPGGQRAYKGHCINLPQNIQQLTDRLPHYLKDVSVIIVRMKGKTIPSKMSLLGDKKFKMHLIGSLLITLIIELSK